MLDRRFVISIFDAFEEIAAFVGRISGIGVDVVVKDTTVFTDFVFEIIKVVFVSIEGLADAALAVSINLVLLFGFFVFVGFVLLGLIAETLEIVAVGTHARNNLFMFTGRFDEVLDFHGMSVVWQFIEKIFLDDVVEVFVKAENETGFELFWRERDAIFLEVS